MYNGIAVLQQTCLATQNNYQRSNRQACRAAVSKKVQPLLKFSKLWFQEIDENSYRIRFLRAFVIAPAWMVKIDKAVEILNNAERPVIYAGYSGVKAGERVITELSRKSKH